MYPANQDTVNEMGIPASLQVQREHATTHAGASVYFCRHEMCSQKPFHAQSLAGLYSHVRHKHLGICLACPYCREKLYWNFKGWKSHMSTHHSTAPHYGSTLIDEAAQACKLLSIVQRDPTALSREAREQEQQPNASSSPKATPEVKPHGKACRHHHPRPWDTTSSSSSPGGSASPSDSTSSSESESRYQTTTKSSTKTMSSSTTSSSSGDESDGKTLNRPIKAELTGEQQQYLREGAHALVAQPTLEALIKHPHAWKQPRSAIVASRDLRLHPPAAQQLATSMIQMDVPSTAEPEVDPLADMPPLEEHPPAPFPTSVPPPKRRKASTDDQ